MKIAIIAAVVFFILAAFFATRYFLNQKTSESITTQQTQGINQNIDEDIDSLIESEIESSIQDISDEQILSSLLE